MSKKTSTDEPFAQIDTDELKKNQKLEDELAFSKDLLIAIKNLEGEKRRQFLEDLSDCIKPVFLAPSYAETLETTLDELTGCKEKGME